MIEKNQITQNLLKTLFGTAAGTSCVATNLYRTRSIFILFGPFASLQAKEAARRLYGLG